MYKGDVFFVKGQKDIASKKIVKIAKELNLMDMCNCKNKKNE